MHNLPSRTQYDTTTMSHQSCLLHRCRVDYEDYCEYRISGVVPSSSMFRLCATPLCLSCHKRCQRCLPLLDDTTKTAGKACGYTTSAMTTHSLGFAPVAASMPCYVSMKLGGKDRSEAVVPTSCPAQTCIHIVHINSFLGATLATVR